MNEFPIKASPSNDHHPQRLPQQQGARHDCNRDGVHCDLVYAAAAVTDEYLCGGLSPSEIPIISALCVLI